MTNVVVVNVIFCHYELPPKDHFFSKNDKIYNDMNDQISFEFRTIERTKPSKTGLLKTEKMIQQLAKQGDSRIYNKVDKNLEHTRIGDKLQNIVREFLIL